MNHKAMQVRCTMDEPMQVLVDKLSSKSSDLYIFWVVVSLFSKTIVSSIMPLIRKSPKFNVFSSKTTSSKERKQQ